MSRPTDPQPRYSEMTDRELCNTLQQAANPQEEVVPGAFIDWVPLILEVLKRIMERLPPSAS